MRTFFPFNCISFVVFGAVTDVPITKRSQGAGICVTHMEHTEFRAQKVHLAQRPAMSLSTIVYKRGQPLSTTKLYAEILRLENSIKHLK